jgi:sec-independent protein translocase protein TatC
MKKVVVGTFLEHLDELRRRLWIAVLTFLVLAGVAFIYSDRLLGLALLPLGSEAPVLYFFTPAEVFVVKMKLALLAGFFMASPVITVQFWLFVSPAMRPTEKRAVLPWAFLTWLLFATGAAFAFLKVLPITLGFLLSLQSDVLRPLLSVSQYLSFVGMMLFSFGVAFNLPIFVLALAATGLVNSAVLNQFQRQVIILIFIAAAILTPGPDIASQLLLALPLILLYELGVAFAWILEWTRRAKKEKVLASS